MIDELSKKDEYWRKCALNICKDNLLADDLVQDMYIYFHNKEIKVNEYYVVQKIYGLFIDYLRKQRNTTSIECFYYIEDECTTFEPDDLETIVLDKFQELNKLQKELLLEHCINDKSLRQIQKEYPLINYGYAYRQIKEAKETILNHKRDAV